MKFQFLLYTGILILLLNLSSCTISDVDKPCTISGIVTDSVGVGLPEVAIHIVSRLSNYHATTLNDGSYIVEIPDAGINELFFTKAGYRSDNQTIIVVGGENKKLDIVLK